MDDAELTGLLDFLRGAEQLKHTVRSAWTSQGRNESAADHTWRLCLMALVFERYFSDFETRLSARWRIIQRVGPCIGCGKISLVNLVH